MTPWILGGLTLLGLLAVGDTGIGRLLRAACRWLEDLPRRVHEHEERTKNPSSDASQGADPGFTNEPAVWVGARYGYGPRPLGELVGPEQEDDMEELPARRVWVAQQLRAGTRPTEIKRLGSELYSVTTRTIDNDIAAVRRGGR